MYHRYLQDLNNIHFFFPNKSVLRICLVTEAGEHIYRMICFQKTPKDLWFYSSCKWLNNKTVKNHNNQQAMCTGSKTSIPLELKPAKYKTKTS
jgi:hypothetical protein